MGRLCSAWLALCAPAAACETALLLAIDVSGSIDPVEYRMQVDGLSAALLDPEVSFALERGRMALAVLQWSGAAQQQMSLDWHRMQGETDIRAFAARVRGMERAFHASGTAPGDALSVALRSFAAVADCERRIIDGRRQRQRGPRDPRPAPRR